MFLKIKNQQSARNFEILSTAVKIFGARINKLVDNKQSSMYLNSLCLLHSVGSPSNIVKKQ